MIRKTIAFVSILVVGLYEDARHFWGQRNR